MSCRRYLLQQVCWHYGSNVGKYVTEVGKLTLKASDPMSVAAVQMTTKLYNVKAPVLLRLAAVRVRNCAGHILLSIDSRSRKYIASGLLSVSQLN